MRTLFIGNMEFSGRALELLVNEKAEMAGVVTKRSPEFNADYLDLEPFCLRRGIPCLTVEDINARGSLENISALRPDLIFCIGWSGLLKAELLNIPKLGVVGFHPAALPRNRGRHPLIWTLVLGLDKTASTFFKMDQGADSGDILSQIEIPVAYEDTARTLYDKIGNVALGQLKELFHAFESGNVRPVPQDHRKATFWRKRGRDDGKIDFRMSSRAIYDLVRALTRPYVGAHAVYDGKNVKIWKAEERKISMPDAEPGKVIGIEGSAPLVKCWDGAVLLKEHEFTTIPKIGEYLA